MSGKVVTLETADDVGGMVTVAPTSRVGEGGRVVTVAATVSVKGVVVCVKGSGVFKAAQPVKKTTVKSCQKENQ